MKNCEYMRAPISISPKKNIDHFKLKNIVTKEGYIYIEIRKGVYGIPQAGKFVERQTING